MSELPNPTARSGPDYLTHCPNCRAEVPVFFGFVIWCESCGWGADGQPEKPDGGLFSKLWVGLSRRASESIFREALSRENTTPRFSLSLVLAFLVALGVHLFTLLLLLAGVYLSVVGIGGIGRNALMQVLVTLFSAAAVLGVALKVVPKPGGMGEFSLQPHQAPKLFDLLERVSKALGTSPPQQVMIVSKLNASFGYAGFQRKRILEIGVALPVLLERQEFCALVGHELAHCVNKDPSRTFLIHTAIYTLGQWFDLLRVDRELSSDGRGGWTIIIAELALRILALGAWLASGALTLLLFRDMQRAEFRADALGAQIGGTKAMQTTLRKMHLNDSYAEIFKRLYHKSKNDFVSDLHRMENIPEQALRRVDRLLEKDDGRLDETHPPTRHRLACLARRQNELGQVSLSAAQYEQIRAEIATLERPMAQRIEARLAEQRGG